MRVTWRVCAVLLMLQMACVGAQAADDSNLPLPVSLVPMAGQEWTEPVTGMTFVWVPGGRFAMGCDAWAAPCQVDELPVHLVVVNGFWMGKYEVTQEEWQKVMGNNPSRFASCGGRCPVEQVSWEDVQEFVKRMQGMGMGSFRLPTEAEWEYACRSGGKSEKYCGGDRVALDPLDHHSFVGTTHPVGRHQPNGLGLYDMSGNVWEWVADRYDRAYYVRSPQDNPQGPAEGAGRVLRGGGWISPEPVHSTDRSTFDSGYSCISLGFRLLRPSH
ncbi:MAG: formylglycine-generating enzyme family protein [Magnetococcus sp. MYC-9]